MTVKDQLLAIKSSLNDWAKNEGGTVEIAIDNSHMWEIGALDQTSPRVILCYEGEDVRGDFATADVTQRVDRRFNALVTRSRGYDAEVGIGLAGIDGAASGNSRPFYDLVEEARERIRFAVIDHPDNESPPYFHSIERAPYDGDMRVYGYVLNFTIGTQLPDLMKQVNRPWAEPPLPDIQEAVPRSIYYVGPVVRPMGDPGARVVSIGITVLNDENDTVVVSDGITIT